MLNAPAPRFENGAATPLRPVTAPDSTKRRPQLRPCRASWLTNNGQIDESRFLIPAHPLFEAAFCAFARGSLVDTNFGPVAIEDLLPGDQVVTKDGEHRQVKWIGATTLVPGMLDTGERSVSLFRLTPDALGLGRPMSHMVVGSYARSPAPGGLSLRGFAALEDGISVSTLTPPSPVELFHLCLDEHAIIRVGGLNFETYHPGHGALSDIGPAMRQVFLNVFPHIYDITDFGLLSLPRQIEPTDTVSAA